MQVKGKYLCYRSLGVALLLTANTAIGLAQTDSVLDPAGYVNKYQVDFNGIGPRVYVLPAPRTQEELLSDAYTENRQFTDSITRALDFQVVLTEFKPTFAEKGLNREVSALPPNFQDVNSLVAPELQSGDYKQAYALLHAYASKALEKKAIPQALSLLHGALQQALKTAHTADVATIQYNLANLYLYTKDAMQAGAFQEAYYKAAVANNNKLDQAISLVKLALIQAADGDSRSAENSIIRKAIPLFNRLKAYEQKVWAWQCLAKIYQLENKHTEAQWFLIQARDLAKSKKYPNELAEIEYMLAFSKFIQQNYKVAKKEFLQADQLAASEDNKLLQLAIIDKLGQVYLVEKELDEAQEALSDYQQLRTQLFSGVTE